MIISRAILAPLTNCGLAYVKPLLLKVQQQFEIGYNAKNTFGNV
jgi:hypothetical protein